MILSLVANKNASRGMRVDHTQNLVFYLSIQHVCLKEKKARSVCESLKVLKSIQKLTNQLL